MSRKVANSLTKHLRCIKYIIIWGATLWSQTLITTTYIMTIARLSTCNDHNIMGIFFQGWGYYYSLKVNILKCVNMDSSFLSSLWQHLVWTFICSKLHFWAWWHISFAFFLGGCPSFPQVFLLSLGCYAMLYAYCSFIQALSFWMCLSALHYLTDPTRKCWWACELKRQNVVVLIARPLFHTTLSKKRKEMPLRISHWMLRRFLNNNSYGTLRR